MYYSTTINIILVHYYSLHLALISCINFPIQARQLIKLCIWLIAREVHFVCTTANGWSPYVIIYYAPHASFLLLLGHLIIVSGKKNKIKNTRVQIIWLNIMNYPIFFKKKNI